MRKIAAIAILSLAYAGIMNALIQINEPPDRTPWPSMPPISIPADLRKALGNGPYNTRRVLYLIDSLKNAKRSRHKRDSIVKDSIE